MILYAVRSQNQRDDSRGAYAISVSLDKAIDKAIRLSRKFGHRFYVVILKPPR